MTGILLIVPILIPVAMAVLYAVAGWRPGTAWAGVAASALLLADAVVLAATVTTSGPVRAPSGLLRADALSAWLLLVMAAVAALACWASPGYLGTAAVPARRARWYGILLHLFVAAMAAAVLAANLGVLWVAIEATTIVTAFLVGHHRTRTALEAAWKYVVICSAAIAIAFLGTVLLYYSARHAGAEGTGALDFATLTGHAGDLDPAVTRIAIALAVVGFGAKAGLVPLHAWLPDAHSQAPAPVSALMSGVLLSVAFYAVLRLKPIADAALGPAFLRSLLLVLALVTLAVAALLLLGQRDYKRMLAYSSMEHMGLVAVGAAVGSRLAIAAVLLHIAGHGLAKTVAFLGTGHILHAHGSTDVGAVRGLASRAPLLAGAFGLAMLALLGLPPAVIFASELGIARAGAAAGLTPAIGAAFALAFAAFAALAIRTARMLLGPAVPAPAGHADPSAGLISGRLSALDAGPLVAGLVVVAGLGVTTWPLDSLLSAAATIVVSGSGA
jgi:hydrogenase-4 component F